MNFRRHLPRLFFFAIASLISLHGDFALAQKGGGLIVDPKRVVFDNTNRTGGFSLVNSSAKDTTTYSISLIDMRMKPDGMLEEITDSMPPDPLSAKKLVRYFPHEVTLGPGESQSIRVQALKPADLAAGEYRSHLFIVPKSAVRPLENSNDTSKRVKIKVDIKVANILPVIYRYNTTPSNALLSDAKIEVDTVSGAKMVGLNIHRAGQQSLYGKLIAKYIGPDGNAKDIGFVTGIGVYVQLDERHVKFPVNLSGIDTSKGKIVVTFESFTGAAKESILSETEFTL